MLQLRFRNSEKGALWLVETQYTVGAGSHNNIVVNGADVLDRQATIDVDGDTITITNAGSNGVKINDVSLVKSQLLVPGDIISIGDTQLDLVDPKINYVQPQESDSNELASAWALRAMGSAIADHVYPLAGTKILGRSKECDISLSVVHLSRKHARLTVTDTGLEITDLNSSNGTFVNGKKIRSCFLKTGDQISFDALKFVVMGPDEGDNQTVIRPQSEDVGALTTVRPALVVEEDNSLEKHEPLKRSSAEVAEEKSPARKARDLKKSDTVSSRQIDSHEDDSSSGSAAMWLVIGIMGIALIGYVIAQFLQL